MYIQQVVGSEGVYIEYICRYAVKYILQLYNNQALLSAKEEEDLDT